MSSFTKVLPKMHTGVHTKMSMTGSNPVTCLAVTIFSVPTLHSQKNKKVGLTLFALFLAILDRGDLN